MKILKKEYIQKGIEINSEYLEKTLEGTKKTAGGWRYKNQTVRIPEGLCEIFYYFLEFLLFEIECSYSG